MDQTTEETKISITKKVVDEVKKLAEELFTLMGLKVELDVSHDKENDAVKIDIKSTDSTGLIIGRRGESISAIQSVLGMMARQRLDGWVRVVVNVGDYREKQEVQLSDLAAQTAQRVRETGTPQSLYNLDSSQRRLIHLALSNEKDLVAESEGEGRDRHLVISLKDSKTDKE